MVVVDGRSGQWWSIVVNGGQRWSQWSMVVVDGRSGQWWSWSKEKIQKEKEQRNGINGMV